MDPVSTTICFKQHSLSAIGIALDHDTGGQSDTNIQAGGDTRFTITT